MAAGHTSAKNRAVFLDRDGTLMEEMHFSADLSKVHAIAGAGHSLAELRRHGWLNVMITNQSGIARGFFTVEEYEAVNAELFRQLGGGIDAVYFCPEHPENATARRKPGTGMLEEATRDHQIAVEKSWFIGDKDTDILCGQRAGCKTILVLTGYGKNHQDCRPDHVAKDIAEAAHIVLAEKT
jgi:D-glycero-D-manno-heptose 1,7-bisphosphate phosphatase